MRTSKNKTKQYETKPLYFPRIQYQYFEKSCLIWEAAVCLSKMEDLPISKFRNPWHNGFLETYHLDCFIAFLPVAAIFRYEYKIKF